MIIGKSLTALGGGGLKPEIRVTAKAGALLNLHYKDSSIILQSYQLGASETTHTFVVGVSETAYVVEDATNGKRVEVLVDTVAQYSVEIPYILWLYKDGDECEDVTGGWVPAWGTNGASGGSLVKNSTSMYIRGGTSGNNGQYGAISTNKIDFSDYSTLKVNIVSSDTSSGDSYGYKNGWNLTNSKPAGSFTTGWQIAGGSFSEGVGLYSIDVSNINDAYFWIMSPGLSTNFTIDKIWLE